MTSQCGRGNEKGSFSNVATLGRVQTEKMDEENRAGRSRIENVPAHHNTQLRLHERPETGHYSVSLCVNAALHM